MKRAWNFLQVGVGLALLAAFTLVLVVVFRAVSGGGAPGALQATPLPQGYPPSQASAPVPPTPTLSPEGYPPSLATALSLLSLPAPEATARDATARAEATAMIATMIVEMTASAPALTPNPLSTFTPLPGGQTCYIDSLNHFSLMLPPGWHSSPPPSPNALAGATVLYNYDTEGLGSGGNFPPGSLKIQVTASKLEVGQSFNQWLSNLILYYTSPTDSPPLTATEPTPYKLGKYEGVSFVLTGYYDFSSMEIVLPLIDGRILIIGLMPTDSSALLDGLSVLSTLDASGTNSCASSPGGS